MHHHVGTGHFCTENFLNKWNSGMSIFSTNGDLGKWRHFLNKWFWEIFCLGARPWLSSVAAELEYVSELLFLQEHHDGHGTYTGTENYTIQLQFSQQGPIRFNPRVSSYNPLAIRRDAGRLLLALCQWNRLGQQTSHSCRAANRAPMGPPPPLKVQMMIRVRIVN